MTEVLIPQIESLLVGVIELFSPTTPSRNTCGDMRTSWDAEGLKQARQGPWLPLPSSQ